MARVRRGPKARARRNKILKLAKGYMYDRRNKIRHATITLEKGLQNAYKGRKLLKRDMRSLWINRISAAAKMLDSSYSRMINSLKQKNCVLNRKMLSEIAARDFEGFKKIFDAVK